MGVVTMGSILGDFRVEGEVGRGGMGVVYRATQISLGRPVALKVIVDTLSGRDGFRDRFQRESRLAASLDHPNVIPVYAAGQSEGVLYIAMRYVEGTDLRALLAAEGALDPARAAGVTAQVASALDVAHERGLVHRDVKPANMLVAARGGGEHVYLTDFGLTKRSISDSGLTAAGEWVGTLDYVAPEQLRGEAVDGRADIYALGCVLYETLTGQVPFHRDDDLAKLWAHISDEAPNALDLAPHVPRELAEVAARAMEKDPNRRFETAGDMGRAALASVPGLADTGARARIAAGRSRGHGARAGGYEHATAGRSRAARLATRVLPESRAPTARGSRLLLGLAVVAVGAAVLGAFALFDDDPSSDAGSQLATSSSAGRVVGLPIKVGDSPTDVDVGHGSVWVANTGDETVSRIDPPRTTPTGPAISVGEDPVALAVGPGNVWVANHGDGTVTPINPGSNRAGPAIPVGGAPTDLVITRGRIWIATESDRLVRVNPETGASAGAPIAIPSNGRLAVGGGKLWVSDREEGVVHSIDLRANVVEPPIPVGADPADLIGGSRSLWVALAHDGVVERISLFPVAGERVRRALPGRPERLARAGNDIWAADAEADSVTRIDSATNRQIGKSLRVGEEPGGIAADDRAVWVSSINDDTVTRIRPR